MEEEVVKSYTDCVYFLASPLTCNKGIECEYRHSEYARLNPRDCWYWLAGSCLNPSCGFRHPPLDIHMKLPECAPLQEQTSTSKKKVEVPCYFYFSGFCKKGDKCSFLHLPNDASKVLKTVHDSYNEPLLENKASSGSNMVPVVIETLPISSKAALKVSSESQVKQKKDVNPRDFKGQIDTPQESTFIYKEATVTGLGTLLDGEGPSQSEFVMYTDQSSEKQEDVLSREDDWLESPPGFDVLVDNKSQNLGYEDDKEHLVDIERDGSEINDHLLEYDYDDCTEYDGIMHKAQRTVSCVESDDDIDDPGYPTLRRLCRDDDEKMYSISIRDRRFLQVRSQVSVRRGVDLRSRLRNHRTINDHRLPCFSERNNSHLKIYHSSEKSRHYGRFKATSYSRQFRKSHPNLSRQHNREKRLSKGPSHSSDISRRPVMRKRVTEEHSAFSGPKTLDQIKEEKRRGSRIGNSGSSINDSEDFQGPKPLSEILKDKRKLLSYGC